MLVFTERQSTRLQGSNIQMLKLILCMGKLIVDGACTTNVCNVLLTMAYVISFPIQFRTERTPNSISHEFNFLSIKESFNNGYIKYANVVEC